MISICSQLERGNFRLDVACELPGQGVTVIFGPSGSGKTSLLRCVAGLEKHASGTVRVNGKTWQQAGLVLPAHKRGVGFVFQQASLFPHLSVDANLSFGAQRRGGPSLDEEDIITTLGLKPLLGREVGDLSGGEQQRVALGRALLSRPELLLLDEPLAALDGNSKARLIPVIENALHLLDIPALYVTHSVDEMVRLADHVLIMEDGGVVANGPLVDLFARVDLPLAQMDDAFSVLPGRLLPGQLPGLSSVESDAGNLFHVPLTSASGLGQVRLKIQARDVSLSLEKTDKSSIINILPATVEQISEVNPSGSCLVRLDLGGDKLLARISEYSRQQLTIEPGTALYAQVKAAALLQAGQINQPTE